MFMFGHLQLLGSKPLPIPKEYYELHRPEPMGKVIGFLAGKPIHDFVRDQSRNTYRFRGVASKVSNGHVAVEMLQAGEWIVDDVLIYALADEGSPDSGGSR
jgi:hypothetical protein